MGTPIRFNGKNCKNGSGPSDHHSPDCSYCLCHTSVSKLLFRSFYPLYCIQNLSQQSIGLLLMYFLLYYLLTGEDSAFARKVYVAVPFNEENTATLMDEFSKIVRTTITSSGAVALVQGAILTITFLMFDIQGAILWGFIATILSSVPVFGSTLVWVPATIIQLLQGDYAAGIAILIAGLFASVIDNFLRPVIQKKVGEIHPFLSLLGIIIGVSLFGLIGIVIGPLLLSYFLLTVEMFSKEYPWRTFLRLEGSRRG